MSKVSYSGDSPSINYNNNESINIVIANPTITK